VVRYLFANYYLTVAILRAVTPAFGRLAAVEARLEGEYRAGMGRIDRKAEEIAFVSPFLLGWLLLTGTYVPGFMMEFQPQRLSVESKASSRSLRSPLCPNRLKSASARPPKQPDRWG